MAMVGLAPSAKAQDRETQPDREDAKDRTSTVWDGEIALRGNYTKLSGDQLDDFDSSGGQVSGEIGWQYDRRVTSFRLEAGAGVTEYTDDTRETRYHGTARALVSQAIARDLRVEASAAYAENAIVLEAPEADQTLVRAAVVYAPKAHRVELFAAKRWREYKVPVRASSQGWQAGARYRYRIASYHWIALGAVRDTISSSDPRLRYKRTSLALDYSMPLSRTVRLVAGLDRRTWTFSGRSVGDSFGAPKRKDRMVRPEFGLAFGKSKGVFGRASAGYDFRQSNDPRYDREGARTSVTLGLRF
jgi:hypothetical protein